MAYDPNDAADKKILKDAIDAALAEQAEEHEASVAGLKKKNTELLDKLKKAEKGETDPAEVARLEDQLTKVQADLRTAQKALKDTTKERDEFKVAAETETGFSTNLLKNNGLTEALLGVNVAKEFLPAVTALLAGQVTIKADGDKRAAFVGDKALGDFVKEWALGAEGKPYIAAASNGGGGAGGGQGAPAGGKTMTRAAYDAADAGTRASFFGEGGTLTD